VTDRNPRSRKNPPPSKEANEPNVFASADVFASPGTNQPGLPSTFTIMTADRTRTPEGPDVAAILAAAGEAAYEWTIAIDALSWSGNAAAMFGLSDTEALASGRAFARLYKPGGGQTRADAIMNTSDHDTGSGVPYQIQYALVLPDADEPLWVEDTGRWFAGADGRPARALGLVRIINERRAEAERLGYLSRFDSLTGEMNRLHLTEELEAALDQASQQRSSCGFMLVALDNLAQFNEAYGFDIADEVIAAVAKRLRSKLRGGDQIGRFSGNKFGIILHDCFPDDMPVAAERLLACVREEVMRTSAGPVAATVTIGGVAAPRHAQTVDKVLSQAQETLAAAKARRRGSFLAYRPNPERETLRRDNVRFADEIVTALNERRVLLAFEPIAETETREPAFYECLMRLRLADGTLAPSGQVVPVAERLGLVRMLDHRVLELLIREMAAVPTLKASVNVSPASITDPDWWSALTALLRANPGIAERLIVEITETTAIEDLDETRGFVARAKDMGCRIAIDDFGSGYTSFRNLRKLGVDFLKIDGAFVQGLAHSEDDRAIVHTLVELAHRLGLKTVAEWVQDDEAAAMLSAWGCDYLQGRLIGLASTDRPWGQAVRSDRRKRARS